MTGTNRSGPLADLRVLDLTTTFMGPYCTMMMARLGADVIKVEDTGGDVVRGINDARGTGMGPIFLAANHGKRSVVLDLKTEPGLLALLKLIKTADVFVTNMRPAALDRLGLTPEVIRAANPWCVYASLVGFGDGGPYAGLAAYDDVIQAVSGMAAVQGGEGEPTYVKSAVADKITGLMAMGTILAAVHARSRTGRGDHVSVPMFETMVAFNMLDHQGGLVYDPPEGPSGYGRHSSPYRKPYRTSDGYLAVVVYTDRMWLSFFDLIERPELAGEPRYGSISARTRHIDELYALVESELAKHASDWWIERLSGAGIPAIPVQSLDELMTNEHLLATGFFSSVSHPTEGDILLPPFPVTFDEPLGETPAAPRLGEHTDEVLAELDLLSEGVLDAVRNA
jgi:crotonobetainyl-CoA:carnitine CoA-transferase CaiB-like acyl-CoA transferase